MTSAIATGDQPIAVKATQREWAGLAVISLPCMLYAMDITVLNLAIPHISAALHPTGSQLLWMLDIYGFVLACLLITMGSLGDRIGRRRLLLIGAAAFGGASIVAALSESTAMIIMARALLGAAAATIAPCTLSLIRQMFQDANQRAFAIAVWTTSFSIGGAIGPLVGGLILERFAWGMVFLLAVPPMVLLLALGPVLLPEFVRETAGRRIDSPSVLESIAGVLLLVLGLKTLAAEAMDFFAVISIAAGASLLFAFARRQRRLKHPLVDLNLLNTRAFSLPLFTYATGCFISFGSTLYYTQYLQLVLGLSPMIAGLWTVPSVVGFICGSLLAPKLLWQTLATRAMVAGLVTAGIGLVVMAQMQQHAPVELLAGGRLILSLGLAIAFVPAINLMLGAVPEERAAEVSAVSETGSELGAALGIAVLGSIGTAWYRTVLASTGLEGLTHQQAQEASETLGGAITVTNDLPANTAEALLDAARAAFDGSMRLTVALSAALVIGLAIVVAVLTRDREAHRCAPSTSGTDN